VREELVEHFALYDEFETTDCGTATEGINAAKANSFDLILLDVDLPDMLGTEACQLMRNANVNAPIVMLTGNDGDMNEILGLNSGANDYVTTSASRIAVLLSAMSPAANIAEIEIPSKAEFDADIRPAIKPVVMRGLVKDWPAVQTAIYSAGMVASRSRRGSAEYAC